ncbi:hypothetical protein D1B31_03895 [Neobacillus notoginsengisoli]|uniref:Uncharacterized protein n=1 Tax=Neobacillus notoginsengisoli TaxID=1578198 RepID=A0A417YYZ4_9BACI|nr:hypothetical protein [Neobacillus notoginsengisoli]RHW42737.1 hypothetical protein D1B31_03895 [Neobacillus notoginsengisoli]
MGRILKMAAALLGIVSLVGLLGCQSSQATAKQVEEKLEEKYGEKFEVLALGNRWGTKDNDTVTTNVKAIKNNVIFETVMYKNGELKYDTYLVRKIGTDVGNVVQEKLKQEGIESKSKLFAMGGEDLVVKTAEMDLMEYIQTHSPEKFVGIMVVEDNGHAAPAKIAKAFKTAYSELNETTLQADFLIVSSEDYNDAVEVFHKNADVSEDWLEKFDIISKFYIYLDKDGNESDNEEILKNL